MKYLILGDLHLRSSTPMGRKDDVLQTFEKKLEQISFLSSGCEAAICLGDIFHSQVPSLEAVWLFYDFLSTLDCPFYTILGNHDVFGGNVNTLSRTQVGHLLRLGLIKLIRGKTRIGKLTFADFVSGDDCNVLLVHEMLLPFPFFGKEILIESYTPPPSTRLVFVGHYHPGFGPVEKDGVTYIGVGSVFRCDQTDRHEVSVYFLDEELNVERFALNVDWDVFVESPPVEVELAPLPDLDIQTFDLKAVLQAIAKERNYKESTVARLLERLEEA